MNCYRKWTLSVSHINAWTLSIHYSSIDSVESIMPRVEKRLIMCKEQSILNKETDNSTKCPALQKKTVETEVKKERSLTSFRKLT